MSNYYIPREEWPKHDMRKLWGLLILGALAAILYFIPSDAAAAKTPDSGTFAVTSPSPWPTSIGTDTFDIKGDSTADEVHLIVDSEDKMNTKPEAGKFSFTVDSVTIFGKALMIKEIWADHNQEHELGKIEKAAETAAIPFTLESHKEGDTIVKGPTDFTGQAKPGTHVTVMIDKWLGGKTVATDDGKWVVHREVYILGKGRVIYAKNDDDSAETPKIHVTVK